MSDQLEEAEALGRQIDDLAAEVADLDAVLAPLREADWQRVTSFRNWTLWDVLAHLHLSDHMGMTALQGEPAFRELMRDMGRSNGGMAEYARRWLADVSGAELRQRWRSLMADLCAGLAAADPGTRLPWVGPGMKPRMFATARQMETWAHAWEFFDLLGLPRQHTDRLRNVATIGVRTFAWTFRNRGLTVPDELTRVSLRAPSGVRWEWNPTAIGNRIEGDAAEFCQVVTQVRNVADTSLLVKGPVAEQWMSMAQCFAGPPVDPPDAGSRVPG